MNLNDGGTVLTDLIKRAKIRVNKKINSPRDTRQLIREIVINNGWNKQIVKMLRKIRDEILFLKKNCSVGYQKLLNYHTSGSRTFSSINSWSFTIDCLMGRKMDPLKSLLGVQRHIIKNISN